MPCKQSWAGICMATAPSRASSGSQILAVQAFHHALLPLDCQNPSAMDELARLWAPWHHCNCCLWARALPQSLKLLHALRFLQLLSFKARKQTRLGHLPDWLAQLAIALLSVDHALRAADVVLPLTRRSLLPRL
jgi:predicted phosphoadenosine phosphosulfate sulfurtransferase